MERRPDIVMILADDQGAWALGCAGNREIRTPNLDLIAERGARFQNFFCASPVCSPARATILTGRIPSAHGVHDWIRSGNLDLDLLGEKRRDPYYKNEKKPIQYLEGMETYPSILAANGYSCALAGKWHLGDSMVPQQGFTRWFTIGRGGCSYYRADVVENGVLKYENRYITDVITDKAIAYIDDLTKEGGPYYLSVHYTAPHDPWGEEEHPKEYIDWYRDCPFLSTPDLRLHPNQIPTASYGTGEVRKSLLRGYYAAVSAMDAGVGRILSHLSKLGRLEDTIVMFLSDNGMNMGHHGIWGKGNGTFPLNLYDTSVKVPFLISWPNLIRPGTVVESMHSQYDIFHTVLELAGIRREKEGKLPGGSFIDVLGGQDRPEQSVVIFDEYGPNRMIRSREWKYIRRYPYGPDELYHLTLDEEEEYNLIDEEEYRDVAERMNAELTLWFYRYSDPAVDGVREGVTGFGQLEKCGVYSEGGPTYAFDTKG